MRERDAAWAWATRVGVWALLPGICPLWGLPLAAFFSFLFIVLLPCAIISLGISQAYYLLADGKPKNGLEAITMSWSLMYNKKIKFLLLQLSFIGWIILSIFTLFFGFLILAPYISSSYATFYDNLENQKDI